MNTNLLNKEPKQAIKLMQVKCKYNNFNNTLISETLKVDQQVTDVYFIRSLLTTTKSKSLNILIAVSLRKQGSTQLQTESDSDPDQTLQVRVCQLDVGSLFTFNIHGFAVDLPTQELIIKDKHLCKTINFKLTNRFCFTFRDFM